MQDCMFPPMATAIGSYFFTGGQLPRTGNRHPAMSAAPYNIYPTLDGHVAIICIREEHRQNLCTAMERTDLASDPRYRTMKDRAAHIDACDDVVADWTRHLAKEDIFEITQRHGVISAPVRSLSDVVSDTHMHERGSLYWHDDASMGEIALCTTPLRFKQSDPPRPEAAGELGQDTGTVLGELLGLDEETMQSLRDKGAV